MSLRYDVIRLDKGAPMWLAASDNFEDAKKLAKDVPSNTLPIVGSTTNGQAFSTLSSMMEKFVPKIHKLISAMRTSFIESFFREFGLRWEKEILECVPNLGVSEFFNAVLTR